MKFDFDKVIERRGTNSLKWDKLEQRFATSNQDVLAMWVADMDFKSPQVITDSIINRAAIGIFGYGLFDEYYEAVINWMKKRYNWELKKEWIVHSPGIMPAINTLLSILTKPGDKVLIQSPVYHVFYRVIEHNSCKVVENPLKLIDNYYVMDYEDLEAKLAQGPKVMLLCSPHNPVGRVWKEEELIKVVELCNKYNVIIISDDIHADLVFAGIKHTPLLKVAEPYKDNIIVCTSPSKAFNLPSLFTANIVIPNNDLRESFRKKLYVEPNLFGSEALKAAYNLGEEWLEQVLIYIEENYKYLNDFIINHTPQLKVTKAEGTYLIWLDCRALGLSDKELERLFINKARVVLNQGYTFGTGGNGFVRINIACPRSILEEALNRVKKAI